MARGLGGAGAAKFKVFLSYSRADDRPADALVAALEARGFIVRIDRRDLPYGEKWQNELAGFIKEADAIVFMVTPRSVTSQWCKWELAQVAAQSKRMVPVVHEHVPPEELPPEVSEVYLFPFTPDLDLERRADQLAQILLTDRAWIQEHTRIADLARSWSDHQNSRDRLLRGQALAAAEQWIARRPAAAPQPSQAHLAFIAASQIAAKRRARMWAGGLAAVAAGATALAGLAWIQRQEAVKQTAIARAQETLAEKRLLESQQSHVRTLLAEADTNIGRFALESATDKALKAAEIERSYATPETKSRAEDTLTKVAALNTYVTRFRSADYRDTIKFDFIDENKLAYSVGREIFAVDLKERALVRRFKLPSDLYANALKAIPDYDLIAALDTDGKIGLFNGDGTLFRTIDLGEKIFALTYSTHAEAELSLAILADGAVYFLDPSDPESTPVKRSLPEGRGGDMLHRGLAFDRSGNYLYWTDRRAGSVTEYSIADAALHDFDVNAPDETVGFDRSEIVSDGAKDRSVLYCTPCGMLDGATGRATPIGREFTSVADPGGLLVLNSYQADLSQMVLFAKTPETAVTGVRGFFIDADGALSAPRQVYLEDDGVKAHSIITCAAPTFSTGFLVCRYAGDKDNGDGLIVWRLPEDEQEEAVKTGSVDTNPIATGEALLTSFKAWHGLDAPFGP